MRILLTLFFTWTLSFAESDFVLNGEIVSQKEYNQAKSLHLINSETFSEINEENLAHNWAGDIYMSNINVNEYLSSNDRNSDEFDVHIDFDEQNPGCGWGEDIPPSTIYQSEFGIYFGDGPSLINECGNFGVSGHSSPVFLGNNYNNTPGDLLISFDNIVSKVQINAGTNSGTIFQMIGYDENNNQIVQSDVLNGINVLTPISVTANGIKSIRVVTSGGDVFVYDDLKIKTGSYQDSDSENYSLSFDGDGDYSHLDWNENLSVYTVSMWVKPNELNQLTFSGILNTYNDDSNGFQLDVNNNQYRY